MMKMQISGKQLRWGVLVLFAVVLLLLRIFREELLKGKNPMLIGITGIGIFMLYRFSKNKL